MSTFERASSMTYLAPAAVVPSVAAIRAPAGIGTTASSPAAAMQSFGFWRQEFVAESMLCA
jgi:hypothetical protein